MNRSAWLSECNKYRYTLSRTWKDDGVLYAYFGINPSTADANIDDATVKKWIGFTERNGGRGFMVGNVFAYRATNVKELADVSDPVGGSGNYTHLKNIISRADVLVPCWGNTKKVPERLRGEIESLVMLIQDSNKPVKVFGWTKSNDPKHPLMLPYSTKLIQIN